MDELKPGPPPIIGGESGTRGATEASHPTSLAPENAHPSFAKSDDLLQRHLSVNLMQRYVSMILLHIKSTLSILHHSGPICRNNCRLKTHTRSHSTFANSSRFSSRGSDSTQPPQPNSGPESELPQSTEGNRQIQDSNLQENFNWAEYEETFQQQKVDEQMMNEMNYSPYSDDDPPWLAQS
ncbi:hypothetical protein BDZ45DRAFT_752421 [Acephala macrosclerotiorum]|nr:hypothetical protein BDZ45DRAFT_752421 [Acephala macrosclerotiorum]